MSELSSGELASFTSWKLDMMDALSCDQDVTDADFRVAFRLLQHVNSVSRIAWPSIERLAAQIGNKSKDKEGRESKSLGRSPHRVQAAITHLAELRWISRERPNRLAQNEYKFMDDRMNTVLDARIEREEALKEIQKIRRNSPRPPRKSKPVELDDIANPSAPELDDIANPFARDGTNLVCQDNANPSAKHLPENYQSRTPKDLGSEERQSDYAAASGR